MEGSAQSACHLGGDNVVRLAFCTRLPEHHVGRKLLDVHCEAQRTEIGADHARLLTAKLVIAGVENRSSVCVRCQPARPLQVAGRREEGGGACAGQRRREVLIGGNRGEWAGAEIPVAGEGSPVDRIVDRLPEAHIREERPARVQGEVREP